MLWLLLLTLPLALGFYWYSPRWWVTRDVAAFEEDGSADSLHGKFHRQRATWRGLSMVVVALAGASPWLSVDVKPWLFQAAGLLGAGGGWFLFDFNPRLSKARGLNPLYVSADPRAALFPDRYVWRHVEQDLPNESMDYKRSIASQVLMHLLVGALLVGIILLVAGTALAWLTYTHGTP